MPNQDKSKSKPSRPDNYWGHLTDRVNGGGIVQLITEDLDSASGSIDRSIKTFRAWARFRQQGASRMFQKGNLFVGLSEVMEIVRGFSLSNLKSLGNLFGPIGNFGGLGQLGQFVMPLALMGGISAWSYFSYARPNQSGSLPPNFTLTPSSPASNPSTTPNSPVPGSPNCTVTIVGGVPKVTCTAAAPVPPRTTPPTTPTTPTNGSTGSTGSGNTGTGGNTNTGNPTTICRVVNGKVTCTQSLTVAPSSANNLVVAAPVQTVSSADPTSYRPICGPGQCQSEGDMGALNEYASTWNGRDPASISLGEIAVDGLRVHH